MLFECSPSPRRVCYFTALSDYPPRMILSEDSSPNVRPHWKNSFYIKWHLRYTKDVTIRILPIIIDFTIYAQSRFPITTFHASKTVTQLNVKIFTIREANLARVVLKYDWSTNTKYKQGNAPKQLLVTVALDLNT